MNTSQRIYKHIAKPHEPTLNPKLVKECVCPNARQTETMWQIERKMTEGK